MTELLDERQVEAEFLARALVDVRRRAVADDGQHRIDRHDAADEERDGDEPEEGRRQHDDELSDASVRKERRAPTCPPPRGHDC